MPTIHNGNGRPPAPHQVRLRVMPSRYTRSKQTPAHRPHGACSPSNRCPRAEHGPLWCRRRTVLSCRLVVLLVRTAGRGAGTRRPLVGGGGRVRGGRVGGHLRLYRALRLARLVKVLHQVRHVLVVVGGISGRTDCKTAKVVTAGNTWESKLSSAILVMPPGHLLTTDKTRYIQ